MEDLFDSCDIVMVCPHCGVKSQHKYLNKIYGRYEFEIDSGIFTQDITLICRDIIKVK